MRIENITYSIINGQKLFTIEAFDNQDTRILVGLPAGKWDKATVVNELIRVKYSQDSVEALINNHLLKLSEWQDKLLSGETTTRLIDPDYDELQRWRKNSKELADLIIAEIELID